MENKNLRSDIYLSVQEAALEILGRQEAHKIFGTAFEPNAQAAALSDESALDLIAEISNELSLKYHLNTARGLLLRIGDAAFPKIRRRVAHLNDLGSIDNRLQPLDRRFPIALEILVSVISSVMEIPIALDVQDGHCYRVNRTRNPEDARTGDLDLYLIAGLLRAFGFWLDSRHEYRVQVEQGALPHTTGSVCLRVLPAQ